jgi:hypothetical protein
MSSKSISHFGNGTISVHMLSDGRVVIVGNNGETCQCDSPVEINLVGYEDLSAALLEMAEILGDLERINAQR